MIVSAAGAQATLLAAVLRLKKCAESLSHCRCCRGCLRLQTINAGILRIGSGLSALVSASHAARTRRRLRASNSGVGGANAPHSQTASMLPGSVVVIPAEFLCIGTKGSFIIVAFPELLFSRTPLSTATASVCVLLPVIPSICNGTTGPIAAGTVSASEVAKVFEL
ncbi:hypothetical protein NDU88_001187 [Pleurodeles waltl]|uniref:Secreted protein n=1 Tax=Pleurodeles waltl TaxID=8319 RepID=A0AAV7Q665_PLEWA|nr:hypothetical protein NDU88_001187 [Pleurodeles waltl]